MDEPKRAIPYTLKLDPMRENPRNETVLPNDKKSNPDKDDPRRAMPYTLKALPTRANPRRLNVDPQSK
jgi:hypothetical protein